jgi:hypothetical protein
VADGAAWFHEDPIPVAPWHFCGLVVGVLLTITREKDLKDPKDLDDLNDLIDLIDLIDS